MMIMAQSHQIEYEMELQEQEALHIEAIVTEGETLRMGQPLQNN